MLKSECSVVEMTSSSHLPRIALHNRHSIIDVIKFDIALECDHLVLVPRDCVEMLRVRLDKQWESVITNACKKCATFMKAILSRRTSFTCRSSCDCVYRVLDDSEASQSSIPGGGQL